MEEILVIPKYLDNEKYNGLLDKYLPGSAQIYPYSFNRTMYKITGKFPVDELVEDLTLQAEMITNDEVKEFNGRFIYITSYKNEIYTTDASTSSKDHINYQVGRNIKNCIGREVTGANNECSVNIYDNNNKCVAKLAYKVRTLHNISEVKGFCGTIGEIIIQLPPHLKNSDKQYYYNVTSYNMNKVFNCHHAMIYFYERV